MPEEVEFQTGNSACGPAQELETVTHTHKSECRWAAPFANTLLFYVCVKDAVQNTDYLIGWMDSSVCVHNVQGAFKKKKKYTTGQTNRLKCSKYTSIHTP